MLDFDNNHPISWYCTLKRIWFNPDTCDECGSRFGLCQGSGNHERVKTLRAALRRVKRHLKYLPKGFKFTIANKYIGYDVTPKL